MKVIDDVVECDALVIGAGPSGSVAARFLAAGGLDVLLADRHAFPRRKCCGDGLMPRAVRDLTLLGHSLFLENEGVRIDSLRFHLHPGKPLDVGLFLNPLYPPRAYVVERSRLDMELLRAAVCEGARFMPANRLTAARRSKEGVWVSELVGTEGRLLKVRSRLLVGADGAVSTVARCLGRGPTAGGLGVAMCCHMEGVEGLGERLEFVLDRQLMPGSAWIFPLGEGRANVGVGWVRYDRLRSRMTLKELWKRLLEESPSVSRRLRGATQADELRAGLLPYRRFLQDVVADGCVLVGDAAGLLNPLYGEGVTFALESGWLAARAALRSWPDVSERALSVYAEQAGYLYRTPFRICRAISRFVQNPWAMWAIHRPLRGRERVNGLAGMFAYRSGAERWKKLIPREDDAFRLSS